MHHLHNENRVLAISAHNNGGIFLVDQDTLQAKALKLGNGEQPWWYMYDVWYDGEYYFGVGGLGDDNLGLRIYDGKNEHRITKENGLPFKVGYLIVPDRENAKLLWIASDKGLIRFNTKSLAGELVNPHITQARQFGDTLWVHDPKIVGYNIKTGKEYRLDAHGRVYYDPNKPDQVWVLHHTNAQLYDLNSKQKLMEVPFNAPTNHGSVTTFLVNNRQQPSVWIGTTQGVLSRQIEQLGSQK
jgi:ligand-binding sensor domain-containing protein